MPFFYTSRKITLDGILLRAECQDMEGKWKRSKFHLDLVLGNDDGNFKWLWRNFHHEADDLQLEGSILSARLKKGNGEWHESSVNLNDHITNLNGELILYQGDGIYSRVGQSETSEGVFVTTDDIYGSWQYNEKSGQKREIVYDFEKGVSAGAADSFIAQESIYEYAPLPDSRSIRLLKIAPSSDEPGLVYCTLEEFSLNEAPPFAALSYTWGNPFTVSSPEVEDRYRRSMTISCDGKRMHVAQNLYEALCRLRSSKFTEKRVAYKKTELIQKSEDGNIIEVERLLRHGADVHARDKFGETALHYASENGHILVVKALVYAGSDIDALDRNQRTPLHCARERKRRFWEETETFLIEQKKQRQKFKQENSCLRCEITDAEYFWIDAICMNQSDDEEKSAQVALMGQIYKKAATVVAWLGPTYNDGQDPELKLLQGIWTLEGARVQGKLEDDLLGRMLHLFDNPNPYDIRVDASDLVKSAVKDWINTFDGNALFDGWYLGQPLFRRSWFSRSWILQEAFMARKITMVLGRFIIPWDILIFVMSFIEGMSSSFRFKRAEQKRVIGTRLVSGPGERIPAIDMERRKRLFKQQGRLPMLTALSLTRNTLSKDPRDKVFSALSFSNLIQPTNRGPLRIRPDYTMSTKELYITVGRALMGSHGPCILSLAGLRNNQSSSGLPSWVPDLRVPLTILPSGIDVEDATQAHTDARGTTFDPTTGILQTHLLRITPQNEVHVAGLLWDTIAEVTGPGLDETGANLELLASWIDMLSRIDVTPETAQQMLWRTLTEDPSAAFPNSRNPNALSDAKFRDWLVFSCFTAFFDLRGYLRSCVQTFSWPDIQDTVERILETQPERTTSLIVKAKGLFSRLGMAFEPNDAILESLHALVTEGIENDTLDPESDAWQIWEYMAPHAEPFGSVLAKKDPSRRLMRLSTNNTLGAVPEMAQVGDVVCMIHGAEVPYVLRGREDGKYQLVGEAYAYAFDPKHLLFDGMVEKRVESICIV